MNWREAGGGGKRRPERTPDDKKAPSASGRRTDWRSKKGRGTAGRGDGDGGGKTWTSRQVDPNEWRRTAFRLRLFGVLAMVAVLIAIFVIIFLNLPRQTQLVVVAPRDTSRGTWRATKDLNEATRQGFRAVASDNKNLVVIDEGTEAFLNPDSPWEEAIRALKLQLLGPDKQLLVYLLSAPTTVREEGGEVIPYFLPPADHPLEAFDRWISVERVLQSISQSKYAGGVGEKLVLIDAQRIEPIAAPGLLYDRFPAAVQTIYQRLKETGVDNLHIIVSHSNGERNWRLPEVGSTAFSYVLQRALRGEADGLATSDREVCLLELVRFLQRGLPGYVKDRRQAIQSPLVLSPALTRRNDDWEWTAPGEAWGVVYVERAGLQRWRANQAQAAQTAPTLPADLAARGQLLDDQWRRFQSLRDRRLEERFPVLAAEAAALLVRMEQLQLELNTQEMSELQNLLRRRLDAMEPAPAARPDTSLTMARLAQRGSLPSPAEFDAQALLWQERIRLRQGIAATDEAVRAQSTDAMKVFATGPVTTLPPWQLLNLVWSGLMQQGATADAAETSWGRFSPEDLAFWTQLLSHHSWGPLPPIESQLLQMLQRQVDWEQSPISAPQCLYLALQAHDRSERIVFATRDNPELLPWIETALAAAEHDRRRGEDRLMASQFAESHQDLTAAITRLTEIEGRVEEVRGAISSRNQASFAAPHLLMWMLRQEATQRGRRAVTGSSAADAPDAAAARTRWIPLIQDLTELDRVLAAAVESGRVEWGETERRLAEQVEVRLGELTREFGTFAQTLEARANDTTTLVDIENALLNPLLNFEVRANLRRRYGEILQGYAARPIPDFSSFPPGELTGDETVTQFRERLQPLVDAALRGVEDSDLALLLRNSFATDWSVVADPSHFSPLQQRLAPTANSASLQADCQRLAPVEGVLRRIAHAMAEMPNSVGSAWLGQARVVSSDLYQAQTSLQSCFEAQRVLEDCWGNNQWLASGTIQTETPYFVTGAQLHLGRLEKSSAKDCREVLELRDRLARYQKAVEQIDVAAGRLEYQPDIPDTPHAMEVHLPQELPEGIAAAMIEQPRDPPALVDVKLENQATARKFSVATSTSIPGQGSDAELKFFLPVQKYLPPDRSRGDFQAAVAFRGHVRTQNFQAVQVRSQTIAAPEEVLTALEPQPLGLPSIEVRKEGKNVTDVIVVIDCSDSMRDTHGLANEGGQVGLNRLQRMQEVIQGVFDSMEQARSFRVALVAFGHRAKLDGDPIRVRYVDPEKGQTEWKNVFPHTDAEVLFDSLSQQGATSSRGYGELRDRLAGLTHFGQTPLYFAIKKAAELLPPAGPDSPPRQIIVLTDGMNQTWELDGQGSYRSRSSRPGRNSDYEYFSALVRDNAPTDLLRAVQVHIVGIEIAETKPEEEAEFKANKEQLESIAHLTGGKILYPRTARELERHLDEIVNDVSWSIRADAGTLDSGPLRMGAAWTPPTGTAFEPGYYTIGVTPPVDSKRLFLEGGEVVVLDFDHSGRLMFQRDDKLNLLRSDSRVLGEGETGGQYTIGMLYPDTHRQENELGFSFQNEDPRQFSQRPKRLGLEILPADNSPKHTLFLQDYNWDIHQQTPIIRFPKAVLSPGQNSLRLWILPFSEKPLTFERVVEVGENRQTTAKWDPFDVEITRVDSRLEVKLSGGDAGARRTMLVDLLVAEGSGWRRLEGARVVRRFLVDGSANFHEFDLQEAWRSQKLAIGLSLLENVFTATQAVTFQDVVLRRE